MNRYLVAENIQNVLSGETRIPTTVSWNRLEGRPRRRDFGRSLRAEVRDPLWLITRQWQFGEFDADDAGSPVAAKVAWKTNDIRQYHFPDGVVKPYDATFPPETVIEARPIMFTLGRRIHNVDLRLELGRRWKQMLESSGYSGSVTDFREKYPFVVPEDPEKKADFPITAHPEAWQVLAAVAGRAIDGGELFLRLSDGGRASDGIELEDPEKSEIDALGEGFLSWVRTLFYQPDDLSMDCWRSRNLEYEARISTPNGEQAAALSASGYRGGRLDWFSFNAVAPNGNDLPGTDPAINVSSFLPATVQFEGMPCKRHWRFEEGAINFGDIDVDTTDIAKLLLIEFGLVFANDWFLLPIDLPAGSLTAIQGLVVTNVFGERYWINPSFTVDGPIQSWSMFKITDKGAVDNRLFIPATVPMALESSPVEKVHFIRDEVSNMVWGIESIVQLTDGSSRSGREVGLELNAKYRASVSEPSTIPQENDAKVKYKLMTSVAEHWIPFIPVHIDGENREIQLQRASMPRLLDGQEGVVPDKIIPRTQILQEGLEAERAYYIAEEEVERAGTVVESQWRRCRWRGGRVVVWLSYRRTVGRGEGPSGLAFDSIVANRK